MEFKFTYEGSIDLTDDELEEIANKIAFGDDVYNIIRHMFVLKYGYDCNDIQYINYIKDDVEKYVKEHYDTSDGKTIKWLISLVEYLYNSKLSYIDDEHYEIICKFDVDDNDTLIKINIKDGVKILSRIKIYIEYISDNELELDIYDDRLYIFNVRSNTKISTIPELNKFIDILSLLEEKKTNSYDVIINTLV